jgi:hypothetical protein
VSVAWTTAPWASYASHGLDVFVAVRVGYVQRVLVHNVPSRLAPRVLLCGGRTLLSVTAAPAGAMVPRAVYLIDA